MSCYATAWEHNRPRIYQDIRITGGHFHRWAWTLIATRGFDHRHRPVVNRWICLASLNHVLKNGKCRSPLNVLAHFGKIDSNFTVSHSNYKIIHVKFTVSLQGIVSDIKSLQWVLGKGFKKVVIMSIILKIPYHIRIIKNSSFVLAHFSFFNRRIVWFFLLY